MFNWFHFDCFLKKFTIQSHEIGGLYDLRWDDIVKFHKW